MIHFKAYFCNIFHDELFRNYIETNRKGMYSIYVWSKEYNLDPLKDCWYSRG